MASAGFSEPLRPDHADADEGVAEPTALLPRMTTGTWVDLCSGGEWLRAQLVWSSQNASLFMFTSQGGRTHTMTRRSCEKLMSKRWLRPVETHPVLDRALRQLTADEPTTNPQ